MCSNTVKIPVANRIRTRIFLPIILKYRIFLLEKLQILTRSGRNQDANFQLKKKLIKSQNVRKISPIANVKVS